MAFDGITMKCIAAELGERLRGGRVDKIYMPDKDAIVISTRSGGKNYKLFLCANPSIPRIYLTESARENPLSPPVFCMLLRKHLSGGHITHISCPDVERVIDELIIDNTIKIVYLQRSRGYEWRPSLTIDEIERCCKAIRKRNKDVFIGTTIMHLFKTSI